jgi:hypothetical protein
LGHTDIKAAGVEAGTTSLVSFKRNKDFSREAGISVRWLRKFEENRLTTNYSMRLQMQMVQALGFGVMEIHQFYKRVDEMTEARVGPPPWLDNEKGGGTS